MLAFCKALESIAFCDGGLAFVLGDVALSVLLFKPCDRLLWWPRTKVAEALSVCAMVASRLKADLGSTESGLSRADVDRNEVS